MVWPLELQNSTMEAKDLLKPHFTTHGNCNGGLIILSILKNVFGPHRYLELLKHLLFVDVCLGTLLTALSHH